MLYRFALLSLELSSNDLEKALQILLLQFSLKNTIAQSTPQILLLVMGLFRLHR